MIRVGLVGLCLVTLACESDQTDTVAENACRHFYNVAQDADILSDEELRNKLKEVNSTADVSDDADVKSAARGMLAAVTQDDIDNFELAIADMTDACAPYTPN